ncbi:DUF6877 family protein [Enterococcus durans]|uniref:DUF6877 family protein n=1 Tax=Enterococcus durans TaxID=53345 RepID=UPI003D6C1D28
MKTTETDTIEQIDELISKYDFPLSVLKDVNHRLECCNEESYVKQQLRYLENLVKFGKVDLKEEQDE